MSIFGVYFVDTGNISTHYISHEETSNIILCALDEEMINNDLDSRPTRTPQNITATSALPDPVRKRAVSHLSQT